ncbi:MAG TPA: hypothetical protein VKB09_05840 [Thermomicrobiales bacterium]|nr:hypothetical protein [Thermomicrobiales bacterium]
MDGIDDRELDIPMTSPVCDLCRHRILNPHRTCAAFPNGIPLRIWRGQHDHTRGYRGDHGLRFSPLRSEDLSTLDAIAQRELSAKGLSIAQLTEQRRRVAS